MTRWVKGWDGIGSGSVAVGVLRGAKEHGGAVVEGEVDAMAGAIGDIQPLAGPEETTVIGGVVDETRFCFEADLLCCCLIERSAMGRKQMNLWRWGSEPWLD